MSKVSETKIRYRYNAKPTWPVCSNCCHFSSKFEEMKGWSNNTWIKESELRCTLGGFKVGRSATCAEHAPRVTSDAGVQHE